MTAREKEVLRFFDGCRFPARQVKIVAELTALDIGTVLEILKAYEWVPREVTPQNYKQLLKGAVVQPIGRDLEHFLTYGPTCASTIEREIKIPRSITNELRRKAWGGDDE